MIKLRWSVIPPSLVRASTTSADGPVIPIGGTVSIHSRSSLAARLASRLSAYLRLQPSAACCTPLAGPWPHGRMHGHIVLAVATTVSQLVRAECQNAYKPSAGIYNEDDCNSFSLQMCAISEVASACERRCGLCPPSSPPPLVPPPVSAHTFDPSQGQLSHSSTQPLLNTACIDARASTSSAPSKATLIDLLLADDEHAYLRCHVSHIHYAHVHLLPSTVPLGTSASRSAM